MNPLTDPYRGWRFEKFAARRMRFFGAAWAYGVVFGGWMSYRFFHEIHAWTWPVRSPFPGSLDRFLSKSLSDCPLESIAVRTSLKQITNLLPRIFRPSSSQYTHGFHQGKYASQATHDNPFSEGHGHGH
jgi:hypothetical protein